MRHQAWLEEPYEEQYAWDAKLERFMPASGDPAMLDRYEEYLKYEDNPDEYEDWLEQQEDDYA